MKEIKGYDSKLRDSILVSVKMSLSLISEDRHFFLETGGTGPDSNRIGRSSSGSSTKWVGFATGLCVENRLVIIRFSMLPWEPIMNFSLLNSLFCQYIAPRCAKCLNTLLLSFAAKSNGGNQNPNLNDFINTS